MMQSGWGKALLIVVAFGLVGSRRIPRLQGRCEEVPEGPARLRRHRDHRGRRHRLRSQGCSARRRGRARHRRDAAGGSRRRRPGSMPRSRHSVMPRSARSYSSWPRLVSPPSARTASCAVATAACRRYIGAPDWDSAWYSAAICIRLNRGATAVLHIDQRSCDTAQLLIVLRMGDEVIPDRRFRSRSLHTRGRQYLVGFRMRVKPLTRGIEHPAGHMGKATRGAVGLCARRRNRDRRGDNASKRASGKGAEQAAAHGSS